MRIKSVLIKNLRSIKEETIQFNNYTSFVGPNGAGKSTVLCALNIFFREANTTSTDLSSLSIEDFHKRDTTSPIEVTIIFNDLSNEAQIDFKDYYRQDQLAISAIATFNETTGRADVKQYGQRLVMEDFKNFFEKLGDSTKVTELKKIYESIRSNYNDLPIANTKDAMIDALRKYEDDHPGKCKLLPSEDQFYGVSKGIDRLNKYIQWVYVSAIKDATQEQTDAKNTALSQLLDRAVRAKVNFKQKISSLRQQAQQQYQNILDENQNTLDDVSLALKNRIAEWAHPEASLKLVWHQDPLNSIVVKEPFAKIHAGEDEFEGEIARFGHGFQRSYLLALLQELAVSNDENTPRLILGCEEPELFQHPPQARNLKEVLEKLTNGNTQVIISTHSPFFVTGENFENVRMVRRDPISKASSIKSISPSQITVRYNEVTKENLKESGAIAKIHQILQPALSEMFFTKKLILVEGLEDAAYIYAWLNINDSLWDAFRRSGCHIVPTNGKSFMIKPAIIAQGLAIPVFAIFDGDSNEEKEDRKKLHKKDNKALLTLFNGDPTTPFPSSTIWSNNFIMWPNNIQDTISIELKKSIGEDGWDTAKNEAEATLGNAGSLFKNTLFIGTMLTLIKEKGGASDSLDKLCHSLINFT